VDIDLIQQFAGVTADAELLVAGLRAQLISLLVPSFLLSLFSCWFLACHSRPSPRKGLWSWV